MASTFRCGLVRPATTTKASSLLHQNSNFLCSRVPVSSSPTSVVPAARTFSTTPLCLRRKPGLPNQGSPIEPDGTISEVPIPTMTSRDPKIPAYPYGERQFYKQSNRGLYGNARVRFGNNVSKKHEVKTGRKWKPNVQRARVWSEALQCMVQTRATPRVLRTIDKVGGLDNYLLGEKPARLKELGPWGWKLRWRIMQTWTVQEKFRLQRIEFGLPPRPIEGIIGHEHAKSGVDVGDESLIEVNEMLRLGEEIPIGKEGDVKEVSP